MKKLIYLIVCLFLAGCAQNTAEHCDYVAKSTKTGRVKVIRSTAPGSILSPFNVNEPVHVDQHGEISSDTTQERFEIVDYYDPGKAILTSEGLMVQGDTTFYLIEN